jgi:hypothetical protein
MLNGKPEHIELSKYVWELKSRNIDYAIRQMETIKTS